MKTNNNSQKIVSAKILAKLVEQANMYVVPFVKINAPGKYTAKEMADEVDSLGNKLFCRFDYDSSEVQELVVRITDADFSESELAELGFSPKIKLTLICEKVFLAIAKYERLAGVRGNNVAKFIIGEPETLYETERAKVVIYEREADTIVTKTKKITIISDTQAVYKQDKETIKLCLKINGKWFAVHSLPMAAYDLDAIAEIVLKRYTIDNIRKGVKATANSQVCNKFVEFCRLIQSELDAMDKLNAEASNTQAADNVTADSESNANAETADNAEPSAETSCTASSNAEENRTNNAEAVKNCNADSDSNVNAEAKVSAEAQSTAEGNKCGGGDDGRKQADAPQINESAPPEQSKREKTRGREIAYFSAFRGCGDKRYHPSGENRNMGIYCGKSSVSQETPRGSPAKTSIYYLTRVKNDTKNVTYKLYHDMKAETMAQFIAYAERNGLMREPFEKVYAMFINNN